MFRSLPHRRRSPLGWSVGILYFIAVNLAALALATTILEMTTFLGLGSGRWSSGLRWLAAVLEGPAAGFVLALVWLRVPGWAWDPLYLLALVLCGAAATAAARAVQRRRDERRRGEPDGAA